MNKIRKITLCALLFITANCIVPAVYAQGGFDDDTDDGPSDMPLDGGMTMAVAGGIAFIVKKVAEKNKQAGKK